MMRAIPPGYFHRITEEAMRICREYDNLAWVYNRYWGRDYPRLAMEVLGKLLFPLVPVNGSILDLCCGTGHVSRLLSERNLRVVGVDLSPAMLGFARENAPLAQFVSADATQFCLRQHFDAVIATFEAMNHILQERDLRRVFENVSSVLKDEGMFVFDLLMEKAYREEWVKAASIVEDDAVCITRGGYDPGTHIAHAEITAFLLHNEQRWMRTDVTVHERWYPLQSSISLLQDSGFGEVEAHDAHSLGLSGSLSVGREFLFARKRATHSKAS